MQGLLAGAALRRAGAAIALLQATNVLDAAFAQVETAVPQHPGLTPAVSLPAWFEKVYRTYLAAKPPREDLSALLDCAAVLPPNLNGFKLADKGLMFDFEEALRSVREHDDEFYGERLGGRRLDDPDVIHSADLQPQRRRPPLRSALKKRREEGGAPPKAYNLLARV